MHAYSESDGTVTAQVRYDDGVLAIRVSDMGRWSEPGTSDEGGRGLELIRFLVDKASVHGTPYGTTVLMQKIVDLREPSAGGGEDPARRTGGLARR
jgi:anti-sigma regulatory factor (Ser/Thr protein kinase)